MSSLILPPDLHATERLRMAAVAERTKQGAATQAAQRKGVADFVMLDDPLAKDAPGSGGGGAAPDDQAAQWSARLAEGLGAFQALDSGRRKAFRAGMLFAVAAVQLAGARMTGNAAPAAAAVFRQLADAISTNADALGKMGRNKTRKAAKRAR